MRARPSQRTRTAGPMGIGGNAPTRKMPAPIKVRMRSERLLLFSSRLFAGVGSIRGDGRPFSSGNARRGDTTDFLLFVETYFAFAPSVIFILMPTIKHLECSRCKETVSAATPQTLCPKCKGALYVRYDLQHLRGMAARDAIARDAANSPWPGMWRYRAVLPDVKPVTLGEGWTPMLQSKRHAGAFLKEEGTNPTGSFKARGLGLAVTMAHHYGIKKIGIPSAGNAAGALAAYAAAAG